MAYKKYIKRGGKTYGPYIYHSKRVDGKVVSEYHGSKKLNSLGIFIVFVGVLFVATSILVLTSQGRGGITGHAVSELDVSYQEGEKLDGKFNIRLNEGELLPASSRVVFENNGDVFEYELGDLISDESIEGSFYIQENSVSGSGQGYGIPGERETFPEVSFVLSILSEVEEQEGNETGNETNSSGLISDVLDGVSNFFLALGPTGNAIVEFEEEVEGRISSGESFTYILQEGQRAELKPRSVESPEGEQLSDDVVEVEIDGNQVTITTSYSKTEEGFGEDYLGQEEKEFVVDISSLELELQPGDLKITVIDAGEGGELISLTTVLEEGNVSVEEAIEEQEETGEEATAPSTAAPGETLDITINVTNETNLTENAGSVLDLTIEERAALLGEFGTTNVEITEASSRNGFITIRYEIGNFWAENSYDESLEQETLDRFMEDDRIKWLKDIVKQISKEETPEEELPDLLGEVEV